jgi:bifunctional enzyme CysN/CysC
MKQDVSSADLRLRAASPSAGTAGRQLLRLLICGAVGDGKSTLTEQLVREQAPLSGEERVKIERETQKYRTFASAADFALSAGELNAARGENIAADAACRCFSTAKRAFIVADVASDEKYTREMVAAASNADVAILVVDARKGLQTQTLRHAMIASLLGIGHVLLAVNKIDLVDFDRSAFDQIVTGFKTFASKLNFRSVAAIPISARSGDNVSLQSPRIPWYGGPHLLGVLEDIAAEDDWKSKPFRMAVERVEEVRSGLRGYGGTIASGSARSGDDVAVAGSGRIARIERIATAHGDLAEAQAGDTVTLVLSDSVDIARGDLLAAPRHRPDVADQFAAHLIWLSNDRLLPGRSYLLKMGKRAQLATVTEIKHRLDANTLDKHAAKTLSLNEVGFCNLAMSAAVAFDSYADNRETGAFILLDRYTNEPVAAGMVAFALRRATNVHYQDITISKVERASLKRQRPAIIWFTGLPGAGKSTIANLVEAQLHARGVHTIMLDGDNVRHGLNKDLGFTDADRVENIRRIGEVAKLMTEAGLIVLCAFISPFRAERRMVRDLVGEGEFIEIFVDTPLEECVARDPKGLYKRALAGQIKNFTGIDQPYEPPQSPEIRLMTAQESASILAQRVIDELVARRLF